MAIEKRVDPEGYEISLEDERWQHSIERHPEMETFRDSLLTTIVQPEAIMRDADRAEVKVGRIKTAYLVKTYEEGWNLDMVQPANEMKFKYDREVDVLYCSFGDARPALGVEQENGVVLRLDPDTDAIVGITIIDFFKRFADNPNTAVSVSLSATRAA